MEEKSQSLENKSKSKKTILSESELDDEPFTEEDLQAIEAAFEAATSSSLPKKRRSSPDDDSDGDDKTQQHHSKIARRRLPSSVLALQHPNAFFLSPCRQANIRMRYPVMKFGGQITYSRTAVQVEKAAMEVLKTIEAKEKEAGQTAVGFDIEWRPTFKRGVPPGKAAVMQICLDTSCCHVMHIVHSGIPQSLQLLLEDASILKVGLGIAGDSVKVFKDYNVSTKAVEDLKYLAKRKLGGGLQNWGLASLTEKLICKQLLKPNKIRLGNWEAKFLSKEQLEYAAIDAFTSWHLYEVLRSLPDAEKVTPDNQSEELQALSL
ncbi:Werner Syndrome-like exonuclease [Prunus avium]|uniref:3'-5' exonuclease n=1 Tax=Prunus avium TaxID=42229 RepID=A0A6P5U5G0_PRUAV|nr:Werner Syndrome-like exonuclease [Prunus avium]XP_021834581.1 Werner Syndrome-like exonuclease [Prunus avium]